MEKTMGKIGRPKGAKNIPRKPPSKSKMLTHIWGLALRAKDTDSFCRYIGQYLKVQNSDRPARPIGTQPDSQKGRRDAAQQAKSDAKAAARAALGKGLAVPELSTHLSPSTASDSAQSAQQAIPAQPESDAAARESAVRVSVHPIPIDAAPPSVPNENTDIRPPEAPKAPNTTVAVISPEEWERMKASVHR